tara:strand:- start:12648 stop:13478 length:831 start_codon:yes stop_codon:yes gene_type:complete
MKNLYGISGKIKVGKDLVGEMLQYMGDVNNPNYDDFQKYVNFDSKYEIKKCADKLKDCVCVILGCTRAQLEDRDFKEKELGEEWWVHEILPEHGFGKILIPYTGLDEEKHLTIIKLTPRLILQLLGTQGGRMIVHPNIWVSALFSDYKQIGSPLVTRVKGLEPKFPDWIITDVRFPENEGKAVSSRGGLLIGIKRLFRLRFPEYENITDLNDSDTGYETPKALELVNPELYKNLIHESETSMGDHSWCDVIIENNGTMEELFNNVLNAVQCQKELL